MKSAAAYPVHRSTVVWALHWEGVYLHIQHLFKISPYYADRDRLRILPSIRLSDRSVSPLIPRNSSGQKPSLGFYPIFTDG
jgi:hypothetical protein